MSCYGLLDETQNKLDYVLALTVENFLERRLQTLDFKSGMAKYIHHARVLNIRQRHIRLVEVILLAVYSGLLYGLYVPDWQFDVSVSTSFLAPIDGGNIYTVNCSVRGDLGPACNSAGMIDRYILGNLTLVTINIYCVVCTHNIYLGELFFQFSQYGTYYQGYNSKSYFSPRWLRVQRCKHSDWHQ